MKEIQYRGGIVSFSIPKHWAEEYEPDGGGMFYEDAPDTGTLRLNIITTRSPKPVSPETAYEELISTTRTKAASVQRLGNGNAMATWVTRSTEEGRDVTFFWWQVANPILPDHLRLALFSYAILTSQEQSESMQRELQLLTESIKNAKFHPTIGE